MLKTFQIPKQTFLLQNIKEQFSKTILESCFLELFFKSIA